MAEEEEAREGFKRPGPPAPAPPEPEPGPGPAEYEEPAWGGQPPAGAGYALEAVRGGVALGAALRLAGRSWWAVGRLPGCALALAHPSVSRRHAVLQYRTAGPAAARGFYVCDLGSAHGTFLNRRRLPPRAYCRLQVGHCLRFGASSRLFVLQVRARPGGGWTCARTVPGL